MASTEWHDYQCDPDMDDRMLLFDSLPTTYTPLADDDPLQSTVSSLASRGIRDYNRSKTSKAARGLQALHVDAGTTTCMHLGRQPNSSSRRTPPPRTTRPDALACPFYKRDRQQHRFCQTISFTSVRSIKQHIIIDHHAPISCPICHSTFGSATDWDQHIVARTCAQVDTPRDPRAGVNEDQVEKLMLRDEVRSSGPRKGERPGEMQRLRWFGVWDTVFPGEPRPASAHMTAPKEREVVALRKYWRKRGRRMVQAALKEEDRGDPEVVEALQESVLRKMMDLARL